MLDVKSKSEVMKYFLLGLTFLLVLGLVGCQSTDLKTVPSLELAILDYDGNTYKTIEIGSQTWMAENLKTKHYWDGSDVGYYDTNGDQDKISDYGLLYDFGAVNNPEKQIAPDGWRIPTKEDWEILIDFLGNATIAGGLLKEDSFWENEIIESENLIDFNARPAGMHDFTQVYQWFGTSACFATANHSSGSDSLFYYINKGSNEIMEGSFHPDDAVSVRFIKNAVD
jgi:uncharacterized protein (TIGR02145 family)